MIRVLDVAAFAEIATGLALRGRAFVRGAGVARRGADGRGGSDGAGCRHCPDRIGHCLLEIRSPRYADLQRDRDVPSCLRRIVGWLQRHPPVARGRTSCGPVDPALA